MSVYIRGYVPGTGRIRSITGTNPAAGVEISETVPAGVVWRLMSIRAVLVCDATAVNRNAVLIIDDGANILVQIPPNVNQTAGTTFTYSWMPGAGQLTAANNSVIVHVPVDYYLAPGYRLRTTTANLQAGDDYGAPQMLVEEWFQE